MTVGNLVALSRNIKRMLAYPPLPMRILAGYMVAGGDSGFRHASLPCHVYLQTWARFAVVMALAPKARIAGCAITRIGTRYPVLSFAMTIYAFPGEFLPCPVSWEIHLFRCSQRRMSAGGYRCYQ
jgi:NADH:ubiquinone oxidoreductase subunit 2 (subunit N)